MTTLATRLNNREAATYLGVKPETLKISRSTGVLCGAKSPAFRRLGRHITYDRKTLDEWIEQFPEQPNTAS